MKTLRFDLDPSMLKVVLVAVLLMLELMLAELARILSTHRFPDAVEIALIIVLGLSQFVTYLITFVKPTENGS